MNKSKYTKSLLLAVYITLLTFILSGCAILKPFGLSGDDNGDGQEVTPLFQTGQGSGDVRSTPDQIQGEGAGRQPGQIQPSSGGGLVTQRVGSRSSAQDISELRFELKRLQAEIAHLNSEITNLNNRSEMWRDPQSIFNKKIVLTNGTIFNGNVVYQDEHFVKVETLIGSLVLKRNSISRILENTPEFSTQDLLKSRPAPLSSGPNAARGTTGRFSPSTTEKGLANVVIESPIKEKKDKSGNTIFNGILKNTGNIRADFVKIDFIIRKDWSGNTETFTTFVNGAQHTYASGVTTDTTLPPGATGTFEIYIPRTLGSFIGYSYAIDWQVYE
ncbi:MAG: hypothetical protein V3U54_10950 [Thermodesulfobacteriota bacterium]